MVCPNRAVCEYFNTAFWHQPKPFWDRPKRKKQNKSTETAWHGELNYCADYNLVWRATTPQLCARACLNDRSVHTTILYAFETFFTSRSCMYMTREV